MDCILEYDSPIGALTLAGCEAGVTGLWMRGQKYYAEDLEKDARPGHIPLFDKARKWLDAYFRGENPVLDFPLAPKGSAFRRAVWDELLAIPHGRVTTYGTIAAKLNAASGGKTSARAVGGAVGRNPISIIIPCHRVVGSNGSLTGFAGGVDKKRWLLSLEKALPPALPWKT